MKKKFFKEKTVEELLVEREKFLKEYKDIKFKKVTGVISNPLKLRTLRRDIARINTMQHMSELEKIKNEFLKNSGVKGE